MTQSADQPELIEVHPIDASMSGMNSLYVFCDVRGQQASYAVCRHTIRAIEEERLNNTTCVECQRAHLHDECIAKKMYAEELAAGHALYFKPRSRAITHGETVKREDGGQARSTGKYDMSNASFARGWAMAGGERKRATAPTPETKRRPSPPKPEKPKSGFVEQDMAAIVNVIAAEQPKSAEKPAAPSPAPTSTSSIKPMPGETPIEFARRRAAMLKEIQ